MYRWYSNAVVCYVFLSDLEPQPRDFRAAFKRCRWFTRGWTLQELIAPPELEFYNGDWTNVGSGRSLQRLIEEVTGINGVKFGRRPSHFLSLQQVPVATKMSWAAGRETAQTEDKAYCLLGIFGINMPLLYGEGDGAFRRLQEEILKRFDDPSIFCTNGPEIPNFDGVGRDVLAPSPASFGDSRDIRVLSAFMDQRYSRTSFSMTNRGLLVQNAYLIPQDLAEDSHYILELNCSSCPPNHAHRSYGEGRCQRIGMFLQWIAPSLYMRLDRGWRLPARPSPSGRHGDGEAPGLAQDFYILTHDAYLGAGQEDVHAYALRNPCVELDSFFPTSRLSIARAIPPQVWDVAARRFVGTGLGCAMVRLSDAGNGGGYFPLATFHIAFALYPGGAFWVRLYPPDEWKDKEADFSRLAAGGDYPELRDPRTSKNLQNGGATYCLLLGTDLKPYRGNGDAPVRVRARVTARLVTESGWEQGRKHITVSIEAECTQGNGRYSGDLRGLRA